MTTLVSIAGVLFVGLLLRWCKEVQRRIIDLERRCDDNGIYR